MVRGNTGFGWLHPTVVRAARDRFWQLPEAVQRQALEMQARWRGHHRDEVIVEEYMVLRERGRLALFPPEFRGRAEAFVHRVEATRRALAEGHEDRESVLCFVRRMDARAGANGFAGDDAVAVPLQRLWWAAHEDRPEASWPQGLDPAVARDPG